MITWHAGNEVWTDGKILKAFGGEFYVGQATKHPENTKGIVGKTIYMVVYQHPEITKWLGAK